MRDYFISFTSADEAFATKLFEALDAAGLTAYFHPADVGFGGNIPYWMDQSISDSAQMLALFSPDYISDKAVYSQAELYAALWPDPLGKERKLIPIVIRPTNMTPLTRTLRRIDVSALEQDTAVKSVVESLTSPDGREQRAAWKIAPPQPKIFSAKYVPNKNFAGRVADLAIISEAVNPASQIRCIALTGIAGLGKTSLASEYCHRFGWRYSGVWWVDAQTKSSIEASFIRLAGRLNLDESKDPAADALSAITSSQDPWLIVLDNAEDHELIRSWFPGGTNRVIITSRRRDWESLAKVHDLSIWSRETTENYLLARSGRKEGATNLAVVLEGLPLAAEQAGAYLSSRPSISFEEYTADIVHRMGDARQNYANAEYPQSVYAVFSKTFESLQNSPSSQSKIQLLMLLSVVSPTGISADAISHETAIHAFPDPLQRHLSNKFDRSDLISELSTISLINFDGFILSSHRLFLAVISDLIGSDQSNEWRNYAIQFLVLSVRLNASREPASWPSLTAAISHVDHIRQYPILEIIQQKNLDAMMNSIAIMYGSQGHPEKAAEWSDKSLELKKISRKDDVDQYIAGLTTSIIAHSHLISKITSNGIIFSKEQYDIAVRYSQELRFLIDQNGFTGTQRDAFAHNATGGIYQSSNELDKAFFHFNRAVEIWESTKGPTFIELAPPLGNLGMARYAIAEENGDDQAKLRASAEVDRSFSITVESFGWRHQSTANGLYNRAAFQFLSGMVASAESLALALGTFLSLGIKEHTQFGPISDLLADIWRKSGREHDARKIVSGDYAPLQPYVLEIERRQRDWMSQAPGRSFGPPSGYEAPR